MRSSDNDAFFDIIGQFACSFSTRYPKNELTDFSFHIYIFFAVFIFFFQKYPLDIKKQMEFFHNIPIVLEIINYCIIYASKIAGIYSSIIVFQLNNYSFWKLRIVQSKIENIFEEQYENRKYF